MQRGAPYFLPVEIGARFGRSRKDFIEHHFGSEE